MAVYLTNRQKCSQHLNSTGDRVPGLSAPAGGLHGANTEPLGTQASVVGSRKPSSAHPRPGQARRTPQVQCGHQSISKVLPAALRREVCAKAILELRSHLDLFPVLLGDTDNHIQAHRPYPSARPTAQAQPTAQYYNRRVSTRQIANK